MNGPVTRRAPEIVFVLDPTQNLFFFELAEALRQELLGLGVAARIADRGFPPFASHRVNVLMPPHEYFVLAGHDPGTRDDGLLARTIGICTEQPNTSHYEENLAIVGRLGRAFDISRFSVAESRAAGVPVDHLQLGYTPLLDAYRPDAERDIDVAFVGCRTERRDRIMAALAPILTRYRCHLSFSDNSRPNTKTTPTATFLWGSAKQSVLQRTRLLLNVHQSDTPYFEWQRAIESISAGAVLLTDTSAGTVPLVPGRHFFVCRPEAFGHVLPALLADDDRLHRVRDDAYRFLKHRLSMRGAAETLLRAAIELAALPSRHARRHIDMPELVHVPEHLVKPAPRPDPPAPPPVTGTALGAAIKRLRLDMIELRRDLHQGTAPIVTRVVHRTAAHRLVRDADVEVSSITALYNHQDLIAEALDSLARGARPSTELVVVDDGSTDGSLEATLRWLRAHDHVPAVLIGHERNRGLAHARNTAAAFARGRFLFVLDADNTIFPDCLERLAEALRADDGAAFAYPLIARHDIFGTLGLHGPFGWDPRRLRDGNYIDAMAMIRRAALLEVGGYSTDRRLYGWEDYDVWCRMAERGLRGVLVPALLARYRESASSIRNVVNVDHTEAYAALFEHAPRLFGGVLDDGRAPNGGGTRPRLDAREEAS